MDNLTNEQLIKRSSHAGRNLFVLASLATIAGLALAVLGFLALNKESDKQGAQMLLAVGLGITTVAIGYWLLGVAARRGNPAAVAIVMLVMVLQLAGGMVLSGVLAARNNVPFRPNLIGLIIPVLIIIALARSRKVLLELRDRGLWEQVFGNARPSGGLCALGGVIFTAGILAMNAGSAVSLSKVQQAREAELLHAKAFVDLVQTGEQEFRAAMRPLAAGYTREDAEVALIQLGRLEEGLERIVKETRETEPLYPILTDYRNALKEWRSGLTLLREPRADVDRARALLALGDKLRNQAGENFDRRFAAPRPSGS